MKFFIDSADTDEIIKLAETGLIDGVTTNPSLIFKTGKNFLEVIREICDIIPGPVSAEVLATEASQMIEEGLRLSEIAENVVVKLPLTWDGLRACKYLTDEGIMVNITLCFSANQALLAAKVGATYISPFIGRLDDIGQDGMQLIEEINTIYANYEYDTEILVASVRHPIHVMQSAMVGADICTIPGKIFKQLANHPLTEKGLESFLADWNKTGQSIL
jgi:transaldolase